MPTGLSKRLLKHAAWIVPLLALLVYGLWPRASQAPHDDDDSPRAERALPVEDRADRAEHEGPREEPRNAATPDGGAAGEHVEVEVTVVDLQGNPVHDALVEARATDRDVRRVTRSVVAGDDWGGGGESDDEEPQPDVETDVEEDVEERRKSIASARTDDRGVASLTLLTDVDIAFHASDAQGRKGASKIQAFRMARYHADESPRGHGRRVRVDPARLNKVRVEIAAPAFLVGRVLDPAGKPVAGADVYVEAFSEVELDDGSDVNGTSAPSGADGRYRIELPASGAFDVLVYADGYLDATVNAVQVLPGRETTCDVTLRAADRIAGVVLDPVGKPLRGVPIIAIPAGQRFQFWEAYNRFGGEHTDSEGRFDFEKLAPGLYLLSVESKKHRPADLFDVRTGTTDAVIRVGAGGALQGTLTVRDLGALKHAEDVDGGDWGQDDGEDDWGDDDDDVDDEPTPEPTPREMGRAKHEGEIRLVITQPTLRATGVPAGREKESPAGYLREDGSRFAVFGVDERGRGQFDVRGLPPGKYELLVTVGTAGSHRAIDVRDGATLTFALELPDGTMEDRRPGAASIKTIPKAHVRERGEDDRKGTLFEPEITLNHFDRVKDEGGLVVVSAAPSTPPLLGGDRLVSVDDTSAASLGLYGARAAMRGPKGTSCRITVMRPSTGETITASLPRTKEHEGW